jgi:hypothetical protein
MDGSHLIIPSSSQKLTNKGPQSLSTHLQPPLSILTQILSYIEHEMSYDALCGVNKQWLIASQSIPNATVRWVADGEHGRRQGEVASFTLAHRKYPRAASLINFPIFDCPSLLSTRAFNISTLRSLSLSFDHDGDPDFDGMDRMTELISHLSLSSSFHSLTLKHQKLVGTSTLDTDYIVALYVTIAKLLEPFNDALNESYATNVTTASLSFPSIASIGIAASRVSGRTIEGGVPFIQLNGCYPIRCQLKPKRHGWTWSIPCSLCNMSTSICCYSSGCRGRLSNDRKGHRTDFYSCASCRLTMVTMDQIINAYSMFPLH